MTNKVCVSKNFTITGSALGVRRSAAMRIVGDKTLTSINDGALALGGALTQLPGKTLISGTHEVYNETDGPRNYLIRVFRQYRSFVVSNPNVIQVRDRLTTAIGLGQPAIPDVSQVYTSQATVGLDLSTNKNATPLAGKLWVHRDASCTEEFVGPALPGEAIKLWYGCYAWTPPPVADNANNGSPEMSVFVRGVRIQIIELPAQEEL